MFVLLLVGLIMCIFVFSILCVFVFLISVVLIWYFIENVGLWFLILVKMVVGFCIIWLIWINGVLLIVFVLLL